MSKAIQINQYGGPEVLECVDVDVRGPSAGEVLLRQTAIGVNMADIYHRSNSSGQYSVPLPAILGLEAAGIVEAVGSNVSDFCVGDRVAYCNVLGAYCEKRLIPASALIKLPDEISDNIAASAMIKGVTAHYLLHSTFKVQAGDTIFVHAAAGGVGLALCQWASAKGARVIGAVSTEEKADLASKNGCDHVIIYDKQDFTKRALEITDGQGVDVIYDSVGADTFFKSIKCVKVFGTVVSFGQSSGPVPTFDISLLAQNGSLLLARPTLATYASDPTRIREMTVSVFSALRRGDLKIAPSEVFAMEDVADAHRNLAARKTTGSIVLTT